MNRLLFQSSCRHALPPCDEREKNAATATRHLLAKHPFHGNPGIFMVTHDIHSYTNAPVFSVIGKTTPCLFLLHPTGSRHTTLRFIEQTDVFGAGHQNNQSHNSGIIRTITFASGYGMNRACRLNNADNEPFWTKFHLSPLSGIKNMNSPEIDNLIDAYAGIEQELPSTWTLYIQVMTERQVRKSVFNPFDAKQKWPCSEFPLLEVGCLQLSGNSLRSRPKTPFPG